MRLVHALLAVLLLLVTPRPAEACSCATPNLVWPADGATDVPLDAVLLASSGGNLFAGDVLVETTSTSDANLVELRPLTPLTASTTYELRFGATVLSTFTTGAAESPGAPAAPEILALQVRRAVLDGWIGGCVSGNAAFFVDAELGADPGAVAYVVRHGDGTFHKWLLAKQMGELNGRALLQCGVHDVLVESGEQRCLELAARGANGQLSAYTSFCVDVEECAPLPYSAEEPYECLAPAQPGEDPGMPAVSANEGCRAAGGAGGWPLVLLALALVRKRRC